MGREERVEEPGHGVRPFEVHVVPGARHPEGPGVGPRGEHGPHRRRGEDAVLGDEQQDGQSRRGPGGPGGRAEKGVEEAGEHVHVEARPEAAVALFEPARLASPTAPPFEPRRGSRSVWVWPAASSAAYGFWFHRCVPDAGLSFSSISA
ncbi:hypothetical protein SSBG_06538 [Streptomyces sp. SPB074]|nr:hypothetical protein SSBG_06538 [Streptomyces sp. SPB074]